MSNSSTGENRISKMVTVVNPNGIHARPADLFVRMANQFSSVIEVSKNGQAVDGKSILGILTLGAEVGTQLEIGAKGEDAEVAIEALAQLVQDGSAESN